MTNEFLYKTNLMKDWTKLPKNIKLFDTAYRRCIVDTDNQDFFVLHLVHNINGNTVKMAVIREGKTTVYAPTKGEPK